MIIPFIAQPQTEEQVSAVPFKLQVLFTDVTSILEDLFTPSCANVKDITKQIPSWILEEKLNIESQGTTVITIFDFLQKYYDWLYCDTEDGSGYQLGLKLIDLIDIDKTKELFIPRLAEIYANGLTPSAFSINGGKIETDDARNFIHNIRKNFYHKKTTIEGLRYFFKVLFNISEEQVKVEYPKKYLLRLNGGRFYSSNFYFPGGTGSYEALQSLSGSCLNFSRIQDGNFYQDYSYLLKVGIKSSYYKDTYKQLAHPAGLKVIYEKTLEDYVGPEVDYDASIVCERSYLKYYSAYGFSYEYTNVIGSCGGTTYYGLESCSGCCCCGNTGFTGPSHAFPNWQTPTISGYNFKDMLIKDMFELCYDNTTKVNPNIGLTCSTCQE